MGLVYHNGKFVPESSIQKIDARATTLLRLRSFLDRNEPSLVRFLVNTWQSQGKAITYKELREAILSGEISNAHMAAWMQDYSKLVAECLQPGWELAIATAAKHVAAGPWTFDPMGDAVRNWVKDHAAEFVTNVTTTQIDGLRAVVQRAAVLEDLSVDELSRVIRPMVGLTKPQAAANMRYYENLVANGVSKKRANDLSLRYAARQHRYRAYNIARTELATSYNQGGYLGTKQAQAAGYMGEVEKVWCTADDEGVCKICGKLDGKVVALDEEFDGASSTWSTKLTAPAHPGCRCAIMYREKTPPNIKITIV